MLVVPTAEPEERRRAQHRAFLDVAVANVSVVAYAGLLGADAPGPSPLLATHAAAEERLARASRALVFRNIATLARADRPLRYEPATRENYRASLAAAGMSAHGIAAFVDVCDGIAGGSFARISPAATTLLGRRPTSVRAFLEGTRIADKVGPGGSHLVVEQ